MPRKLKDITGLTVGYLTAVGYVGSDGKKSLWKVRCACGKEIVMPGAELTKMQKKGVTPSCGCMKSKTLSEKLSTHRMSKHPAWAVWHSMRQRCECPTHHAWNNYGGRGIKVCERWSSSFEAFWADMGPTYQRGLSLDRIDNNGNYEPSNCRWATPSEQGNNTRKTRFIDGYPLTDWEKLTGIGKTTLLYRLDHGCPKEHLFDPPDVSRKFTTWSTQDHATDTSSLATKVP